MTTAHPPARNYGLVGAEILRLRKRKGLMLMMVILTIGIPFVIGVILSILHAASPLHYGPAGGQSKYQVYSVVFSEFGPIAGILVGAAAGSADVSAGIFRLVVATGRSRVWLYTARVAGMLIVFLPVVIVTVAAISVFSVGMAQGTLQPTTTTLVHSGAWILLECAVYALIALGFSAVVGSRSITVGVGVAFALIIEPLLGAPNWHSSIGIRQILFSSDLEFIRPNEILANSPGFFARVHESGLLAGLVIAAWVVGVLVIGVWRTQRQDA